MLFTIAGIIIGAAILFIIGASIHKSFVVIPRCRRELGEALQLEQESYDIEIDKAVADVRVRMNSETNALKRSVYEVFVNNYRYVKLHNLYIARKADFKSRADFNEKFVQEYYKQNESQLEELAPSKSYDIESLVPDNVLSAYYKVSDSFNSLSRSHITNPMTSVVLSGGSFFYLNVGNTIIPKFENGKGVTIFIYPTFAIYYKGNSDISIVDIKDFSTETGTDIYKEYSSENVPADVTVVGYEWKYMTKNGNPDGRYSNNPRYTLYKCGILFIKAGNFALWSSNLMAVMSFNIACLSLRTENLNAFSHVSGLFVVNSDNLKLDDKSGNIQISDLNIPTMNNTTCKMNILRSSIDSEPLFIDVVKFVLGQSYASISSIQRKFVIGYCKAGRLIDMMEALGFVGESNGGQPREIKISISEFESLLDKLKESERVNSNELTGTQTSECKDIIDDRNQCEDNTIDSKSIVSKAVIQLDSLIGLNSVKNDVRQLIDFIKIQKLRVSKGMKVSPISYHCVFTGNPGTGKTTVARIIAEIYKDLGILSKGHLIETDRSGLVAEYVGQTAVKTNKIVDSALDGVLFIDEAYSLVSNGNSDFGNEAVTTLLKRMEDDRTRLVVILAGYENEMKDFITSNPGLQSRFNRYVHFDDYSVDELMDIYKQNLEKNEYTITTDALIALRLLVEKAFNEKDNKFGNGRFIRNIFEKTLQLQASRLSKIDNISVEDLQLIIADDIPA